MDLLSNDVLIPTQINYFMNIIEKDELTTSIQHIDKFSKSEILTCNLDSYKSNGEDERKTKQLQTVIFHKQTW